MQKPHKVNYYKKPTVTARKIEVNFFFSTHRFFDSLDHLMVPTAFAQSCCGAGLSCGGCCNTGLCLSLGGLKYP